MKKLLVLCLFVLFAKVLPAHSRERSAEVEAAVQRGLRFLANQQSRWDGHWEEFPGQYPITMTALAGMALLMEGSTPKEGKYWKNIRKAVDYLMKQAQPSGRIGNPNNPGEAGSYMYGHGYALMFLACAYGEEDDKDRRENLAKILANGAAFSRAAQTKRMSPRDGKTPIGGWGYIAAKEGNNFDEGSVPVTQFQALRAVRNAGIAIPKEAFTEGLAYLNALTNAEGGVIYTAGGGAGSDGRPAITVAAICCGFSAGDYNSSLVRKWFRFVEKHVALEEGGRAGYDEYTHYYYAQALYILGDEEYGKLMKDVAPAQRKNWYWYKKQCFPSILNAQRDDGGWSKGHTMGPIYQTSIYLTILQLENGLLPLHQQYHPAR